MEVGTNGLWRWKQTAYRGRDKGLMEVETNGLWRYRQADSGDVL